MKRRTNKNKCGCRKESLLTPADAVMAVAILAVSSDGRLANKEMEILNGVLFANPLFEKVENSLEYMARLASIIADNGRDTILEKVSELLSQSLRETAYAWAVYMVAADRKFVSPEHGFLEVLRKKFGIHVVLAGKIKAVVPMLNRIK